MALDHRMKAWPSIPAVSTEDLYNNVRVLSDAVADEIAVAVMRRYDLNASHRARLFRCIAAIQHTRMAMRREVRELLLIGSMDSNDVLVAVQRIADWFERKIRHHCSAIPVS